MSHVIHEIIAVTSYSPTHIRSPLHLRKLPRLCRRKTEEGEDGMRTTLTIAAIIFLIVPTSWALHMYGVQGDPRWLLSIIGCPIMGAILFGASRLLP